MLDEDLFWLINWFDSQCEGYWERLFGIKIQTIDNPGWAITISIQETELENKSLQDVFVDRTDHDWYSCRIENKFFKGYCGTFNIEEVIRTFRNFAGDESSLINKLKNKKSLSTLEEKNHTLYDNLHWLIRWYDSQCNGDWEYCYGIGIDTLSNPGWSVSIGIQETDLEDKIFEKIDLKQSKNDWFICEVKNKMFQAHCGTYNLIDVLKIFRDWSES